MQTAGWNEFPASWGKAGDDGTDSRAGRPAFPFHLSEFGSDVAFWRRPPSPFYTTVLDEFMQLAAGAERWDDPLFASVLTDFRRRFRDTNSEEGMVTTVPALADLHRTATPPPASSFSREFDRL